MQRKGSMRLVGIGASPGAAVGPAYLLEGRRPRTPKFRVEPGGVAAEVARLEAALAAAEAQLEALRQRIEAGEGPEHALLVEAHRMMLRDPAFAAGSVELVRRERINAERAVRRVARRLREAFRRLDGDVFQERRSDVEFVADRVIRNLVGARGDVEPADVPAGSVLVVRDLSPADAASLLVAERVAGLLMERGTQVSHTSIIAHARGVPAVVGLGALRDRVRPGDSIALDGTAGVAILRPDEGEARSFLRVREATRRASRRLGPGDDGRARTTDGVEIELQANLELEDELPSLGPVGAREVGLYRTEFLALQGGRLPTEEEQLATYRRILAGAQGRPVTFRTFDFGADKLPKSRRGPAQSNPALGLRALRLASREPELLRTQLRALLRASAHGPARILFPMVSGVEELDMALEALARARKELRRGGAQVAQRVEVGVMIEVPAAALVADHLAERVDFLSIGTNDLVQYALATDRHDREVAYLYRPLHPAILRLIRGVVDAGAARGVPVTACGEMAGEPALALALVGLGVRRLSMTAASIPAVRRALRQSSGAALEQMMEEALALPTATAVEELVRRRTGAAVLPDPLATPDLSEEDGGDFHHPRRQEMAKRVGPKQAHQLMQDEGYVYVDVRSPEEYERSHPQGAVNLPFLFMTDEGRKENPAFLDVFRKIFPPGSKVVIGCAGGNRSAAAVRLLQAEGWDDLVECGAGFSGARDASGAVVEEGWSAAGLPCVSGQEEGKSWESLRRK